MMVDTDIGHRNRMLNCCINGKNMKNDQYRSMVGTIDTFPDQYRNILVK